MDCVIVDEGKHDLRIRLEYQPATGSSLIVGGIVNLVLRAGTNKTFETTMEIQVIKNHIYQLRIKQIDDELEITLFDQSSNIEVLKQRHQLSEGNFERIF